MNRIGYITAILLAVLLCGSCINEEYAGPDPDLPTRTIIVYLGGDNNLSEETGRKIEALRQGWTYTGNKCLIYQDSRDGARLLRLRGGCRTTPTPYVETVREYGAENSASAETFARVLREVAAEYPADSYGLIFFSHASGWLPAGALQNPAPRSRSVGVDDGDAGHAEMDIAEFAAAIPGGMFDFIVLKPALPQVWKLLTNCAGSRITCWLLRQRSSRRVLHPFIRRHCGCCATRPWRCGRRSKASGGHTWIMLWQTIRGHAVRRP